MRNFFIILIACFCLVSDLCTAASQSTPEITSISILDRNGFSETISNPDRLNQYKNVDFLKNQPYQKVLRIYSRDKYGAIRAYITSYHPNGQPKQYIEVVNNRAYGMYREWYPNGVTKLDVSIVGGIADLDDNASKSWLFNGNSRAWDEQGNLLADIVYSNGILHGDATYYHPNCKVWKIVPARNGLLEGTYAVYLENGSLLQSTEYSQGLKHGASNRYWDGKQPASEEVYRSGMLMSGRYYSPSGEFICDIEEGTGFRAIFGKDKVSEMHEYQRGVQAGEVKVFDQQGVLVSIHHVKNGMKNGEETEYFEPEHVDDDLMPKISVNWVNGKIQGNVKTWYANGVMESQREMNNNEKNGVLTAWYEDGSVMMLEEYDHEKLVKGEYFAPGEKISVSLVSNGKGIATIFDSHGNLIRKINYNNGRPQD